MSLMAKQMCGVTMNLFPNVPVIIDTFLADFFFRELEAFYTGLESITASIYIYLFSDL